MITAAAIDRIKTITRAFYSIVMDLGLDSSTVDVLISLNLLIKLLSKLP
jgi:hypothetical protein